MGWTISNEFIPSIDDDDEDLYEGQDERFNMTEIFNADGTGFLQNNNFPKISPIQNQDCWLIILMGRTFFGEKYEEHMAKIWQQNAQILNESRLVETELAMMSVALESRLQTTPHLKLLISSSSKLETTELGLQSQSQNLTGAAGGQMMDVDTPMCGVCQINESIFDAKICASTVRKHTITLDGKCARIIAMIFAINELKSDLKSIACDYRNLADGALEETEQLQSILRDTAYLTKVSASRKI